jgi:23S rRNA (uracil1939-C5)-methyltransferase
MAHRGLGVGRCNGQVVFLFGALPGEEVTARITGVRRRHAFADTVEVHRRSPDRVDPACPHFGVCGGCQLQHAAYEFQLRTKRELLEEALRRRRISLPERVEAVAAPEPYGYRWRGELHRGAQGRGLGFTARGSYRVVEVQGCPIHHPVIDRAIQPLGQLTAGLGQGVETIHLTVGADGAELLLQSRPDPAPGEELVATQALTYPEAPRLTAESTGLSYRGRSFRVHPDSFIQVNQAGLGRLYETVVEWLADGLEGQTVVDAYGGSGWLGLRLADEGAKVLVIEQSPISARLCQLHGEMYEQPRLEVRCGPVEELLPKAGRPDVVVVDPPRSGLAPQVSGWLAMAGPPTVVYLSCEVSALARDLEALCRLGPYRLERLRLVDMFPQTYHFETAALLRRS